MNIVIIYFHALSVYFREWKEGKKGKQNLSLGNSVAGMHAVICEIWWIVFVFLQF
jgi:hypothetical protein